MYEKRTYRNLVNNVIKKTTLIIEESDLDIYYNNSIDNSKTKLDSIRNTLKTHIIKEPKFKDSLIPIKVNESDDELIKKMKKASKTANVGPMASVAGAVSETLGQYLAKTNKDLIIENGGDVYINSNVDKNILINAGTSPLSNKIYIKLKKEFFPLGICTSSGTIGHSLSFGKADAVIVLSKDTLLADSLATSICNIIQTKDDIENGINLAKTTNNIFGIIIIIDKHLGAWGNIEIKRIK